MTNKFIEKQFASKNAQGSFLGSILYIDYIRFTALYLIETATIRDRTDRCDKTTNENILDPITIKTALCPCFLYIYIYKFYRRNRIIFAEDERLLIYILYRFHGDTSVSWIINHVFISLHTINQSRNFMSKKSCPLFTVFSIKMDKTSWTYCMSPFSQGNGKKRNFLNYDGVINLGDILQIASTLILRHDHGTYIRW